MHTVLTGTIGIGKTRATVPHFDGIDIVSADFDGNIRVQRPFANHISALKDLNHRILRRFFWRNEAHGNADCQQRDRRNRQQISFAERKAQTVFHTVPLFTQIEFYYNIIFHAIIPNRTTFYVKSR